MPNFYRGTKSVKLVPQFSTSVAFQSPFFRTTATYLTLKVRLSCFIRVTGVTNVDVTLFFLKNVMTFFLFIDVKSDVLF